MKTLRIDDRPTKLAQGCWCRDKNDSNSASNVVKRFGSCTTPDKVASPPPSEAAVLTVPSARMQVSTLYQTLNSSWSNGDRCDTIRLAPTRQRARLCIQTQDSRSREKDAAMIDNLHFIKEIAFRSKTAMGKRRSALFRRLDA